MLDRVRVHAVVRGRRDELRDQPRGDRLGAERSAFGVPAARRGTLVPDDLVGADPLDRADPGQQVRSGSSSTSVRQSATAKPSLAR
jgi:hypothetical protein